MRQIILIACVLTCLQTTSSAAVRAVIRMSGTRQVVRLNDHYAAPRDYVIIDPAMQISPAPAVFSRERAAVYSYPQSFQMRSGQLYRKSCSSGRCRWVPANINQGRTQ